MLIKRVEFRELCSHAEPKLATTVLLQETHEWKLEGDWLHWRIKGGEWHASHASMIRNVTLQNVDTSEQVPTVRINPEVAPMSPEPELILDTVGDRGNPEFEPKKRRGKKA